MSLGVIRLTIILALSFTFTNCVQDAVAQKKQNPAFALPDVDPSLPNVLLIGDSISIGYTLEVRKQLLGKANVFRPQANCGPTTTGLKQIDQWLGDRKWDLVHYNFGLHDLKFMGPKGENLADPKDPKSAPQVALEDYRANLKKISERLKRTGAKMIWRETSPVPEGAKGRVVGDAAIYNRAAAEVIDELGGIEVDPFFAFAESISSQQKPANVHYTPEGSRLLGKHVAGVIEKALP